MKQRHSIDILFSLSLFTVFVICAFLVLLFQTGSYQVIIKQGEEVERMRIPLVYLRAEIRSADEDGAVSVRQLKDTDAIVIHDKKERIVTYIYEYEGELRELYANEEVKLILSARASLFAVYDFGAQENGDLLQVSIHDEQGKASRIIMELKSEQGGSTTRGSHASKSMSFLMELISVLFFFTLAGAICIPVSGTTKNKNNLVANARNALQHGESLMAQRETPQVQQVIQEKIFYLGENGNRSSSQVGYYRVEIEQEKAVKKSGRALCELCIYRDDREFIRLPFLLEGGVQK